MIRTDDSASRWRTLWLIPVALFAVLTIVATGGGGGGDDGVGPIDDIDPGPVNLLPTYNFLLTNLSSGELLTASLGSGLSVSIDIDGILHNSFDLSVSASNEVTFLSYVARRSSGFDLIVTSGGLEAALLGHGQQRVVRPSDRGVQQQDRDHYDTQPDDRCHGGSFCSSPTKPTENLRYRLV